MPEPRTHMAHPVGTEPAEQHDARLDQHRRRRPPQHVQLVRALHGDARRPPLPESPARHPLRRLPAHRLEVERLPVATVRTPRKLRLAHNNPPRVTPLRPDDPRALLPWLPRRPPDRRTTRRLRIDLVNQLHRQSRPRLQPQSNPICPRNRHPNSMDRRSTFGPQQFQRVMPITRQSQQAPVQPGPIPVHTFPSNINALYQK